ncbi:methylated-DNA--[protein]-cysteine S-methyltransferase [Shewanella sp.]|uniref:methylated-DNA--[protein]-cysteine S-methyltransferase n=1 Tax=Shewanella sp. TaxID=50422 RepID=UPI003566BCB5
MTTKQTRLTFAAPAPCVALCELQSPVGSLWLGASAAGLMHLVASPTLTAEQGASADSIRAAKAHLHDACAQLNDYFAGSLDGFELTLAPKGTDFQRDVWRALAAIPFGETCSYSDIANRVARPKAVRAVGAANGANPIAIIVPCHRVIGKGGSLTGYAWGLEMKSALLSLESRQMTF